MWVLGRNVCIDASTGVLIDPSECGYQWIGHLCQGPGFAPESAAVPIKLPLNCDSILPLIDAMRQVMKDYFPQSLLALGAGCMVFHYSTSAVLSLFYVAMLVWDSHLHCDLHCIFSSTHAEVLFTWYEGEVSAPPGQFNNPDWN